MLGRFDVLHRTAPSWRYSAELVVACAGEGEDCDGMPGAACFRQGSPGAITYC
jgi:hypothetical protein